MNLRLLNRYQKIISYFKNNPKTGFVEKHHIIPKCLGGSDDISNIVLLSPKAHYIAHLLLHKAYPLNTQLALAFAMMSVCNNHQHRKITSRMYDQAKTIRMQVLKGKPRPEWVKQKMRKPKLSKENYKKPKSSEHRQKISQALKGVKKTENHIKNLVEANTSHYQKRTKIREDKIKTYRKLFIEDSLNRHQFALKYNISYGLCKSYLKGL